MSEPFFTCRTDFNIMSEEKRLYYFDKYTAFPIRDMYKTPPSEIPVIDHKDVLVVGGSPSGVCAAVAAARNGADVMLVERFGFLGGQSVYGMVVQWEKRAFINNLGAVLTEGLPKEILERVLEKGCSDGLWFDPPGCPEMRDGEEWLNPEAIKVTLLEICEESGVDILLHTFAEDVIVEHPDGGLPLLRGVIFVNKTGRFAVTADVVIDATADLDLVWKAIGEDGCGLRPPSERIGAGFYVWYGGVNTPRFIEWYLSNPDARGGYPDPVKYPDKVRRHVKEEKLIYISGATFNSIMEKADDSGYLDKIGEIAEKAGLSSIISLSMKWVGKDRWCTHFTSLPGLNMLDMRMLTAYEIFRTKLAFYMLPVMRLIPGWENCYISRENIYMGSRETRWLKAVKMIDGDYIFDPSHEYKPTPPDTIGRSGAHDPGKNRLRAGYPIPYWILVPEKLDGVIVCGRAVGALPPVALNAHRGITPCMVTGEGAGTAAALAVKSEKLPREIDLAELHDMLRKNGVRLDHKVVRFDFEIPADKIRKYPTIDKGGKK